MNSLNVATPHSTHDEFMLVRVPVNPVSHKQSDTCIEPIVPLVPEFGVHVLQTAVPSNCLYFPDIHCIHVAFALDKLPRKPGLHRQLDTDVELALLDECGAQSLHGAVPALSLYVFGKHAAQWSPTVFSVPVYPTLHKQFDTSVELR